MTAVPRDPFDFFAVGELATPGVSEEQAQGLARDRFGLQACATSMGSQQDANFLLADPSGSVLGVLKVTNAAWGRVDVDAQEQAIGHLSRALPWLRLPQSRPGVGGATVEGVALADGQEALARVGAFVAGGTLHGDGHLRPDLVAALGRLAGQVSAALAGFDHVALGHVLQWDLQHADRVVGLLAEHVDDAGRRAEVVTRAAAEWARLQQVAARLPQQAIHGDLTDDNVVRAVHPVPVDELLDGVIDLGDLTRSWAVAELAVTLSSLLHHDGTRAPRDAAGDPGLRRAASAVRRRGPGAVAAGRAARRDPRRERPPAGQHRPRQRVCRGRARARVADPHGGGLGALTGHGGGGPGNARAAASRGSPPRDRTGSGPGPAGHIAGGPVPARSRTAVRGPGRRCLARARDRGPAGPRAPRRRRGPRRDPV